MKKLLILIAVLAPWPLFSQKVPGPVKSSFSAAYPEAQKVKWEPTGEDFTAYFKEGNAENTVVLNPQGRILLRQAQIPVKVLPEEASAYVAANFTGKPITEAALLTDIHGVVTFLAQVDGKELIFTQQGAFQSLRAPTLASKK